MTQACPCARSLLQGHFHHRQQLSWRRCACATHHFQESHQVNAAVGAGYQGSQNPNDNMSCVLPYNQQACLPPSSCLQKPVFIGSSSPCSFDCHPANFMRSNLYRLAPIPRHHDPHCSIIFCEAVAIYGVIVAIILQTKLEYVTVEQGLFTKSNMAAGYAIFAAGLTCGLSNLVCGCAAVETCMSACWLVGCSHHVPPLACATRCLLACLCRVCACAWFCLCVHALVCLRKHVCLHVGYALRVSVFC